MLKEDLVRAKQEKERCRRQYPDWKDDEYNCGPLKYILGIQANGTAARSFNTLNDLDIYFNRDTQKFVLSVDFTKTFDNIKEQKYWLRFLLIKLTKALSIDKSKFDFSEIDLCDGELFIANSLIELYCKFFVFVNGFISLER